MNSTKYHLVSKMLPKVILLIVANGFISFLNASTLAQPPSKQDDDWNEIVKLQKDGEAALKAEARAPSQRARRIEIYGSAVNKLAAYIKTYETNRESLTYLRGIYRLALYLEYADQRPTAMALYEMCLKHPLIQRSDAVYDNKPIAQLAKHRILFLSINGIVSDGHSSQILGSQGPP